MYDTAQVFYSDRLPRRGAMPAIISRRPSATAGSRAWTVTRITGRGLPFHPAEGGDDHTGYRCPVEWITIRLMETTFSLLARATNYRCHTRTCQ